MRFSAKLKLFGVKTFLYNRASILCGSETAFCKINALALMNPHKLLPILGKNCFHSKRSLSKLR